MDVQWGSFISGILLGAVGAFAVGFLRKAGGDTWNVLKNKVSPPDPEPISVANGFDPHQYAQGDFSWVPEFDLQDKEAAGYSYFLHPNNNAKCYRQLPHRKEFLMRKPG